MAQTAHASVWWPDQDRPMNNKVLFRFGVVVLTSGARVDIAASMDEKSVPTTLALATPATH